LTTPNISDEFRMPELVPPQSCWHQQTGRRVPGRGSWE